MCNWFASKKIAFKSLVLTTIYTEISHVIDVNSSSMNGEKSWCQSQVISHNSLSCSGAFLLIGEFNP
ncbi:hypothetical protein BAZOLSSOX_679 [uncultured Gammaproteobacteria bacterium]|nr:hypothetical protein BAZOLSSOX_679 [uncultured Gammaproteobacteria bacterium]